MCTTIIEEEWRDIAGYEGLYQVSNLGRVKSLNYHRSGKEQILKQYAGNTGYLFVRLFKNGKYKNSLVHRIVSYAFIQNPDNLPQVNHKDENPKNNRFDNLEWCDRKYNCNYGTRNEKISAKRINNEKISKPVLCIETGVIYPSSYEAFRQTGAHQPAINACCKGKIKTTKGFHWRYAD